MKKGKRGCWSVLSPVDQSSPFTKIVTFCVDHYPKDPKCFC